MLNPPMEAWGWFELQRQRGRGDAGFKTTASGAGFGARFHGMGGAQKAKLSGPS
jgi:hypothetical protein